MTDSLSSSDPLYAGREAAAAGAWDEARSLLAEADVPGNLSADDVVTLGTAAYLLGDIEAAVDALSRAHRLWLEEARPGEAVRTGFWAAFILMMRGEMGPAGGWLARCQRLLEDLPEDAPEHGYPLIAEATRRAAFEGDYPGAIAIGERVIEVGRRTGEPDLLAFGLMTCGRARVRAGDVDGGLACLDEAMVSVVAGELTPPAAGAVYCSVIEACSEISELRRANEWTGALTRWCDRQHGMVTFTGQCLTHRSVLLRHRGDWPGAEEEARRACQRFVAASDEAATGQALYHLGEVHRLRGEAAEAEDAYRRAGGWGYEPQPGLALLRLSQGRTDAAVAALVQILGERADPTDRLPLLAAVVEVMIEAGRLPESEQAAAELEVAASTFRTSALRAEASRARGRLLLAGNEPDRAVAHLRSARDEWSGLGAPYEVARTRVLLGRALRAVGDVESADREEEEARAAFVSLGARPDLESLESAGSTTHGLSPRELEVLRLVATGMTNQVIADELFLAVKTVDRHVSNILTKLGVPSRTAATAFAYQHELI